MGNGPREATWRPWRLTGWILSMSANRLPSTSRTQASFSQLPHSACTIWTTSWARAYFSARGGTARPKFAAAAGSEVVTAFQPARPWLITSSALNWRARV
ncbi:hypothetical protein SALBM135S_05641 [Streptomyces alboniger]